MRARIRQALAAILGCAALAAPGLAGDLVLRAGTVHPVDGDGALTDGAAVHVRDGRIVAVGKDIVPPPGARVVDYGPSAVLVPGFLSADAGYARGRPSRRTAEPGLSALDGFDFYGQFAIALSHGVTSAYISPAQGRLIAGQGAVVKLGGEDPGRRVIAAPAAIHGSVGYDARNTPGYWEPPIPPTVDTGLGYARPQLPHSLPGAVVALEELLDGGDKAEREYGATATTDLAGLAERGTTWRMGANSVQEIRALLDLAERRELPLVIDGAREADHVVNELLTAGVGVIFDVPFSANGPSRDWGKSEDDYWPDLAVPAELAKAGVPFAISHSGSSADLLFAARLASRGGLDPELALRAITRTPAELLGAADRIGSLEPGKDADILVLNGPPMAGGTVSATWLDGELAWSASSSSGSGGAASKAAGSSSSAPAPPVVIEVEELHVGDGRVHRPGAMLLRDGRIVAVGPSVARAPGAVVVRGFAATPGLIDAYGHLGLEGTKSNPSTDFPLERVVGPGDATDRRVARAGVTTVVLAPRGKSRSGVPMMPYKPAATDHGRQVVADPITLRVDWSENNRRNSGGGVRDLLEKAAKYVEKWAEYEEKLAEWEASPPEPEKKDSKKDDDEDEDDEEEDEKDDDDKKSKKKKKDDEEPEADPVTGIWEGTLVRPPFSEEVSIRIQLVNTDGAVEGSIRCSALSQSLIRVQGHWNEDGLDVAGLGSQGWVRLTGEPKKGELEAKIEIEESEIEFEAKRVSQEVPRAKLPDDEVEEEVDPPKGMPRAPKLDEKLEPFRRAMAGDGTILVQVDRADEIVECVEAFASYGIRPILYDASDLHLVLDEVRGRIAGVLLDYRIVHHDYEKGLEFVNRYARIAAAGVPIGFHSGAEEGAADLPLRAAYAVSKGLAPGVALRALTGDVAGMYGMDDRIGLLEPGLDADVVLFDGPPLDPASSVVHTWVNGREVNR